MPKTETLTQSLRSRSWQPYRLFPPEAESETLAAETGLIGAAVPSANVKQLSRPGELLAGWTLPAICFVAAVVAVAGTIGPDARWLAVLGRTILRLGSIPAGIPFAAAPSTGWHNVPVLAELGFRGLQSSLGDRGLLLAQIVAVVVGVLLIVRDARRLGATDVGAAAALIVLPVAGLLAFAGIRAQLFSFVLFPALVSLLRAEERAPSRRIWLLVPLIALWSNLHGAALVGLGVAVLYLLLDRARRRPLESSAVFCASALALCATPALAGTPGYYAGVLANEAATRGYGLWAPLSLHSGFDLLLVIGAVLLLAGFVRARPRPWQIVAAAILAALTVHASRNGIWLLLFLAGPAASALRMRSRPPAAVSGALALIFLIAAIGGFVRGPLEVGPSTRVLRRVVEIAHGRPILAEPAVAEQLAAAGGRVWISNPLDAFNHSDQRLYLDWLQGRPSGNRLDRAAPVIMVSASSAAARRLRRDRGYELVAASSSIRVFARPGR
jgi:hypothetical protein